MRLKAILLAALCCAAPVVQAQPTDGSVTAIRIPEGTRLSIDGRPDETFWAGHPAFTDRTFTQQTPQYGQPASFPTAFAIAYDDEAVYVAFRMPDPDASQIARALSPRDQFGHTDIAAIGFDPYGLGSRGYIFFVTAAGVQADQTESDSDGGDISWNAVWESAVDITDTGWTVEMRIPFAALRFPAVPVQNWNVLAYRQVRRLREESFHHPIRNEIDGFVTQWPKLHGIRDVEPPLRLELFPYASVVRSSYGSGGQSTATNFGMDLRYGLDEAFTLDMTLVPDFSQVRTDDLILNLSPFDVRYSENRPFFTEGVDLFNKFDLFYSRRIGQSSRSASQEQRADERIDRAPSEPALLNATKLTGRTSGGTGVGLFNAITQPTTAVFTDTITGLRSERRVDPWMNFSAVSVDQVLRNRSSVGFLNTNVWRGDGGRKANVLAGYGTFYDRTNTWGLETMAIWSRTGLPGAETDGYALGTEFGKVSGNFTYEYGISAYSPDYRINDFGFQTNPDYVSQGIDFNYEDNDGWGPFEAVEAWWDHNLRHRFTGFGYTSYNNEFGMWGRLKNNWNGFGYLWSQAPTVDRFEARVPGYLMDSPAAFMTGYGIRTDDRPALSFNWENRFGRMPGWDGTLADASLTTTLRVGDRLRFTHEIERDWELNLRGGFGGNVVGGTVLIGRRDVRQWTNTASARFTLSPRQSADIRVYAYHSQVRYKSYYALNPDGSMAPTAVSPAEDPSRNFTFLNLDFNWQWEFAPGSFLNLNAQTNVNAQDRDRTHGFGSHLGEALDQPRFTSVSVKVIYFFNRF